MTSTKQPFAVLLVEDNPAHAELVLRGFEELPIANTIQHVRDGEEALDYLFRRGPFADAERSPRPHLILMDLRLPKIDGVQIIGEIKSCAQFQQIPIVVLSTSNAESDVTKAYEQGANSYLVKPLDFAKFKRLMVEIGEYWLGCNSHP